MFFGQFYETWVSVTERNTKFLLETVTYIAITEIVTCIAVIEIVICIMRCRKYHQHNCKEDCYLHDTIKIVTLIFAAKTVTCISATETFNSMITAETVTCINALKRSTNTVVTESTTFIIAMEPKDLRKCNR